MRTLALLIALICCAAAQAQDTPNFAVKGYLGYSRVNNAKQRVIIGHTPYTTTIEQNTGYSLSRPNPAFALFGKSGFHEIEVVNVRILNRESTVGFSSNMLDYELIPYLTSEFDIHLKYEYAFKILKKKNNRISPYIGLSFAPLVNRNKTTIFYPTRTEYERLLNLRASLSLVPRVTLNLSRRIFLDLNSPIDFLSINAVFEKENRFSEFSANKSFTLIYNEGFPKVINARLGAGIKL